MRREGDQPPTSSSLDPSLIMSGSIVLFLLHAFMVLRGINLHFTFIAWW
jgi:hypothetical protein